MAIGKRPITAFLLTQTTLVWLAVFEPISALATPAGRVFIGVFALGISASYLAAAVSVSRTPRSEEPAGRFAFLASVGLLFLAEAVRLLIPGDFAALVWGALGVIVVLAPTPGGGDERRTRGRLALALTVAAGARLAGFSAAVWLLPADRWTANPMAGAAGLILLAGLVYVILVRQAQKAGPSLPTAFERGVPLTLVVIGLGALAIRLAAPHLESAPSREPGLAVLRTAVLSISALLLASAYRRWRLREALWGARIALYAGGIKLVFDDLRSERPAPVVASLVLYGLGLILATRIAGRGSGERESRLRRD